MPSKHILQGETKGRLQKLGLEFLTRANLGRPCDETTLIFDNQETSPFQKYTIEFFGIDH